MIVSASYRTDIPAFYGAWFRNRFRAGFARVANPYGGPESVVPLRDGIDGFVFWTRNAEPFVDALREVRAAGLPFVVSHTVTGGGRAVEPSTPEPARAVRSMRALAAEFGPRAVVWRFDPILLTDSAPAEAQLETFTRLAEALAGAVDECVISFATLYKKSIRNLKDAGVAWSDPPDDEKRALAGRLAEGAQAAGMRLTLCSQADYCVDGTTLAACIDAQRLEDVAAGWGLERTINAKIKGNRPDCACHESRDIGAYDTCPMGCAYCYAVSSQAAAKRRYRGHDAEGERL
ncbi:DUF1848 domain-containing protein [Magnetospirillum sp. UT-4]|uniref:DUF1848 domain-containing protein n=1 Tax=Magnetospirillum sp. UT-4 TaxID=2681467 RepID=UPI00137C4DD0|nr:DUF1848 domain-containing protein [Magnetospirillum sp. UT-4]CAA7616242.1 conserved hypothetical protein [Magnetospirillum sp. UT-4]